MIEPCSYYIIPHGMTGEIAVRIGDIFQYRKEAANERRSSCFGRVATKEFMIPAARKNLKYYCCFQFLFYCCNYSKYC